MYMIRTQGLTRQFRVKKEVVEAVRGVDIEVKTGEMVALLGPNGAGKSTTLRMLTTLLPPTAGTASVAGCDVRADPAGVRRRIGYIGQGNGAGHGQRVRDELLTQGRCYGLSHAESRRRADELLATLDLESLAARGVGTLSGGQRRRLDIALGLVHRPELLFLDEPSTGLDPHNRANLWEHILRLRKQHGTTIFLTTHYLDEADSMAERVLIVDHGRVIADDTPEKLKADLAGDRIILTTCGEADAARAAEIAGQIPSSHDVAVDATTVALRVTHGPAALPELLRALDAAGVHVATAEVKRPTLDDVFLALTGRSLRESDQ
jgi:ABC-2 type transport system ATP-binding protein